ncbi:kinase-like domain-containing protein [Suillus fuscotomentosus]|uniref:Kinase-like domain-containing protein n=1 Tax=Suillus fuscotomentosus TaxID=1912939 RepID=A0AAD4EHP5_9AGAM|nr:kinase-like domain-containing protein [Suillus fuscotomentosus]KAG1906272.1 kinase-like domain-containing protein [Suillus fuscotomentosus]
MVFPWMHNGSLATYLQRSTELTIESKLRILWQVAAAINYLHLKGIVHGDLTANNILIDANHDAYVSDHGILTMCSELCGTSYIRSNVRWAAPELFEVPENLPNSASDVYSFGCIMFQVMTGQPPFADVQSNHAVALQIFAGEKPQRPSNPSVAESFWDFIETCWRDAGGRPSAADVVSFLELVQRNL